MALTALNYAKEYSAVLANAYPNVLHFGALYSAENNRNYRWLNGDTVEIPTLSVGGRKNSNRDTITLASRNYANAWEPKKLTFNREWSTTVHPRDIDETNMVGSIGNITKTYNETQKFPEKDAYTASKLAAGVTPDTTVLDKTNILDKFDAYMAGMNDANVPINGRIMYVTPATSALLKKAEGMARNIAVQDPNGAISRIVKSLDGVTIQEVPSSLMKSAYDFTDGYKPASGAKQINMILIHPSAVVAPTTYNAVHLDSPTATTGGKWVYFEEEQADVFILSARKAAIIVNQEA